MSFSEIKEEVQKLSEEERLELLSIIRGDEDDDWDKQMKADADAGLFDEMIARAEAEHTAGESRPLPGCEDHP